MGVGADLRHFHLFFGAVLCAIGAAMLLYVWLRPNYRRGPVLVGAAAHLLGGLFWVLSVVAVDAPGRVQVLLGALRALPYEFALAYVCYLVVRSVGKNHPRTARVLATGPYALPCLPFLTGAVCVVFFPQQAIDYVTPGTAELLVPRARNLVEAGYLVLITTVFLRETLRRSTRLLRTQNACLTVAGLSLLAAILANLGIAAARVLISDRGDLARFLGAAHAVQLAAMSLAGVGFLVGIVLYHSAEEREALLERCRDWIKHRYEIEAAAYNVFGAGLCNSESGARVAGYFYRAAAMLGIPRQQQEQGRLTVALLALMLDPRYRGLVSEVRAAQRELLGAPEFDGFSLARLGGRVRYDIRDDALYNALEPAQSLARANPPKNPDPGRLPLPCWVQLAAVLAADAGFLPEPARSNILGGHTDHATAHVLHAYRDAKHIEDRMAS
jgi:drug/metabolite transporter superfamily protein YnfA